MDAKMMRPKAALSYPAGKSGQKNTIWDQTGYTTTEARMKDKTREEYDAAKLQKLEDEQTSLNQIGQLAYSLARSLREMDPEELKGAFEMQ